MIINTKFNIGDFVKFNNNFGFITDIKTYFGKNNKLSIKYIINTFGGKWINEDNLTCSNQEEACKYYKNLSINVYNEMY